MAMRVENSPGRTVPVYNSKQVLSPTVSTYVTLSAPLNANWALVQALGANVRWWDDGSVPTVSNGFQLANGAYMELTSDLVQFKAIAESGTPTLNVTYYNNVG